MVPLSKESQKHAIFIILCAFLFIFSYYEKSYGIEFKMVVEIDKGYLFDIDSIIIYILTFSYIYNPSR